MSQNFKLRYDQMRESNPTNQELPSGTRPKPVEEFYQEEGHFRNICFVWQNGKRIFLNYSYLIAGEYLPDESIIKLTFTSHKFILKGVNLENLFYEIMYQFAKQVTCVDVRYNLIGEDERFVVNEIILNTQSNTGET